MGELISPVEFAVLQRKVTELTRRVQRCEEWIDTVSSPWWKRVVFVLRGYRWKRLGCWRGPDRTAWPPPNVGWWRR